MIGSELSDLQLIIYLAEYLTLWFESGAPCTDDESVLEERYIMSVYNDSHIHTNAYVDLYIDSTHF